MATANPSPISDPAVPGAAGRKPAPPTVAIHTAAGRFSATVFLNLLGRFRGANGFGFVVGQKWPRNSITSGKPVVEVNHLATLAAKGPPRVILQLDLAFAHGAAHGVFTSPKQPRGESAPSVSSALGPPQESPARQNNPIPDRRRNRNRKRPSRLPSGILRAGAPGLQNR